MTHGDKIEREVSSERVSEERLREIIADFSDTGKTTGAYLSQATELVSLASELLALRSSVKTEDAILPCDVSLPPATIIRAGAKLSTLIEALNVRGMAAIKASAAPSEVTEDADEDVFAALAEEELLSAIEAPAAEGEVTDAMVDAAHEAIEQSYRTESWEFGPPYSLARSILTAAIAGLTAERDEAVERGQNWFNVSQDRMERISSLEEENKRLREALKPFGAMTEISALGYVTKEMVLAARQALGDHNG